MLAAEDRAGLGHDLLDVAVADPRADRRAAEGRHGLGDDLRADQVVEHGRAWERLEHRGCDERGRERPRHARAGLVDEEHPVRVAVERQADVRAHLAHLGGEIDQVLGLDRVRGVVGKGPVELLIEVLDLEGQWAEHEGGDEPAHPVGRVRDDVQRPQSGGVDEPPDVGRPGLEQVENARGREVAACGLLDELLGQRLDLDEAALLSHRTGARQAQLDPVVLRGVVRRREHRRGAVEVARGEVDKVRRAHAEVDDLGPACSDALGKRARERDARWAHVARDGDPR